MEDKNNKSNKREITYNKNTHRYCACCGKLLPIEEFDKHGKSKVQKVCRNCKMIVKKGNSLESYTIQTLLRELSKRGVKGKFTYTRTETIEI